MGAEKSAKAIAKQQKSFWKDFKDFITKGNVIGLAVGVVLGGAFQAIVNSVVNDVIMPIVGLFTTGVDFAKAYWDLTVTLKGAEKAVSIEQALEQGHVLVSYGNLITVVINFFIIALVVFLIVRSISNVGKLRKKADEPAPPPTTKKCPYCISEIPITATRCAFCTSEQPEEESAAS